MKLQSQYVTIQQTYKRWKFLRALGWCTLGASLFMISSSPHAAAVCFLTGCGIVLFARMGRWWENG